MGKLEGVAPLISVRPAAKSTTMQSRMVCQDINVCLEKPPYLPGPAKSLYVLSQGCDF